MALLLKKLTPQKSSYVSIVVTNEDTTMNTTEMTTEMTTQELIEKVTDIFDLEFRMKVEREKGDTRELSELQDRHKALSDALPNPETNRLQLMICGMARDCSSLRRRKAMLVALEAELKELIENAGWKRTTGQESRAVQAKRADIAYCQELVKTKQKEVDERQKFFDYIEDTDRYIAELGEAAAGIRISPRIQAKMDADWEAKKADIKRSYEEYEKSLEKKKDESTA